MLFRIKHFHVKVFLLLIIIGHHIYFFYTQPKILTYIMPIGYVSLYIYSFFGVQKVSDNKRPFIVATEYFGALLITACIMVIIYIAYHLFQVIELILKDGRI